MVDDSATPRPSAFNPAIALATSMHAQPGVYALLLGSGVSTGVGIPTGWGVVQALVRTAAAAQAPGEPEAADNAAADPEAWWTEHGDGAPLGYSNLLAALSNTSAGRRAALAHFFEPSDEELADGMKRPGPAHHAIAELVRRGSVRVIVTTNFDRLIERALEEAGVPPQVISRADAVTGMAPLAHSRATVVKIHGDYADLDMRNTVEELSRYTSAWDGLLDQIFAEYGLLVCGWSAEWDSALRGAIERVAARRYPLYWDSRSARAESAQRTLSLRGGTSVTASNADDLFTDLVRRLDALDRLAEPPLTTAMAIAQLKRYLPDPTRRIDLYDLVISRGDDVVRAIRAMPTNINNLTYERIEEELRKLRIATEPLLKLVLAGVRHDRDRQHVDIWIDVLNRLLGARAQDFDGTFQPVLVSLQHYPALLVLRTAGLLTVYLGRDDVLLRLLLEPRWRDRDRNHERRRALSVLGPMQVLNGDIANGLPRWNGQKWIYPQSHLLRDELEPYLADFLGDTADYKGLNDRYEYRVAMAEHLYDERPMPGEFIGEWQWTADGQIRSEADFHESAGDWGPTWPWWRLVGVEEPDHTALEAAQEKLRERLAPMRRWG